MNTVLDDSKILCLPNGERISLNQTIRVIFEVDSLMHASPATISRLEKIKEFNWYIIKIIFVFVLRCAMVYFESSDLGVTPYLKNWFDTLPKDIPEHGIELLEELFEFSLEKG